MSCPVCASPLRERHLLLDRATIALCQVCGHGISAHVRRRAGAEAYAAADGALTEYETLYLPARRFSYRAGLQALGDGKGRRLLDFGCNYGHFLAIARREGWDVWGYEPGDALRASALPAVRNSIDGSAQRALGRGPYDAVTMWDVLEHIDDPARELDRLRTALGPAGRLLVRVPDARALAIFASGAVSWLLGQPYLTLCHPTNPEEHRHHFTPESLIRLGQLAGLRPAGVWSAGPGERVVAGRTRADTAVRRVLHRLGQRLPYEFTIVFAPDGP